MSSSGPPLLRSGPKPFPKTLVHPSNFTIIPQGLPQRDPLAARGVWARRAWRRIWAQRSERTNASSGRNELDERHQPCGSVVLSAWNSSSSASRPDQFLFLGRSCRSCFLFLGRCENRWSRAANHLPLVLWLAAREGLSAKDLHPKHRRPARISGQGKREAEVGCTFFWSGSCVKWRL